MTAHRFVRACVAFAALALIFTVARLRAADEKKPDAKAEEGFKQLFNGKDFDGWKVTKENSSTFKVENGEIVIRGPRAHLFYVGDDKPFKDFELRVDVMTEPGANGGIYICTKYQDEGWPKFGFEAQVNNSFKGDPKRTASLYGIKDVLEAPAKDNEWFTETIIIKGKNIKIKVNDKTLVDYDEPADQEAGKDFTRKIEPGTFALQAHDPKSVVHYKNIRVKRLD